MLNTKERRTVKETSKLQLRLKLEGHPNIWYQNQELTTLRALKARALLYFLVVEKEMTGQSSFPKEKLVDLLWPGMPTSSALQNLRQTVYRIRKAMPLPDPTDHIIVTDRHRISLHPTVDLSTDLFWVLPADQQAMAPSAEEALQKPKGPLLHHFSVPDAPAFDEWVDHMRDRLLRTKTERLNNLVHQYAAEPAEALPFSDHLTQLLPYDEQVMSGHLQLLQRNGQSSRARQSYQLFAERLKTDLNQEPDPALLPNIHTVLRPGHRSTEDPPTRMPSHNHLIRYGLLAGLLLLMGFWLGSRFLPQKPALEDWRIAVLPFQNQTDNPFLAEALTDEIIIALSKVEDITTISRQSSSRFRNTDKTLQQIGKELGTPYVLQGKLSELDGAWYVQVELISTDDGRVIWSDGFRQKEEKVYLFQQSISREVIRNLTGSLDLTRTNLTQPPTKNHQAYQAYLKGRNLVYQADPDSLNEAITFFQKAVDLDPDFKLAYAEIAKTYTTMAGSWGEQRMEDLYPKIRAALDIIVDEPELESLYFNTLAWVSFWMLDIQKAERYMQKCVSINPNEEFSISALAMYKCLQGEFAESEALAKQGLVTNPHFFWNYFVLAQTHFYAGQWAAAEEVVNRSLELLPTHVASIDLLANIYIMRGQTRRAVDYLLAQKNKPMEEWSSLLVGSLGVAYQILGENTKARDLTDLLIARHRQGEKYCAIYAAQILTTANQLTPALDLLEQALEQRDNELNWVPIDYTFRPLHDEPRFQKILQEIGLESVL